MDIKDYKYDAFISYRHCEPDQFVAEQIHKQLEAFKLPRNVISRLKKDNPNAKTKIKRVFRDSEELPLASNLADPIIDALKNSEWLIVICSPRLKESDWCKKEIETFISLHGRDNVLAVLVEGEPKDSFPAELTFREIEVKRYDGTTEKMRESIEPLAADVRAENDKGRKKKIKSELTRLVAPMFNLEYDELKQRHRERMLKRGIAFVSLIAAVCFSFGVTSTLSALTIKMQRDQIEAISNQISEQSLQIASQNEALTAKQAESLAESSIEKMNRDERTEAVRLAYKALTKDDGIEMPYTDLAMYALINSLKVYEVTGSKIPMYTFETRGIVEDMYASPRLDMILIKDSSDTITLWSVDKRKIVDTLQVCPGFDMEQSLQFIDDKTFIYSDTNVINSYDMYTGESDVVYEFGQISFINKIRYNRADELIYIATEGGVIGIDKDSHKEKFRFDSPDERIFEGKFKCLDDKLVFINFLDDNTKENINYIIDKNGNITFCVNSPAGEDYTNVMMMNDVVYILSNSVRKTKDGVRLGNEAVLRAYSYSTGEEIFDTSVFGITGKYLWNITTDNETSVILIADKALVEVNAENGEVIFSSFVDSNILWQAPDSESSLIYVTGAPKEMFLLNHTTVGGSNNIECNLSNVDVCEYIYSGVFLSEKNSNKVIYYSDNSNEDMIDVYDGTYKAPETIFIKSDKIYNEEIKSKDLPEADMIETLAYIEKGDVYCVTGKDGYARLYSKSDKSLITEFKLNNDTDYIKYYCGEDNEGNQYWAGSWFGYCLSKDGNLIATIELLRGVDADNNLFILGYDSIEDRYSIPIFSKEELLKMAEDYLSQVDNE